MPLKPTDRTDAVDEAVALFPALRGELTETENKALVSAMNREGFKLA